MPDPPPPVPPVIRLTLQAARWASMNHLTWIYFREFDTMVQVRWEGDYELRVLHAVWDRSPTGGPPQDQAITTHHFINITDDEPDDSWDEGDYDTVEDAYKVAWGAIKGNWSPRTILKEFRWYKAGPAFRPRGTESALIERVLPVAVAGTAASGMLPPQVAVSITEKTESTYYVPPGEGRPGRTRGRWGRFYLPAPSKDMAPTSGATEGLFSSGNVDLLADAFEVFYNTCRAADLFPVMYSPTTGDSWSVDQIQVDNIWDVIRRRRFEDPTVRDVRTLV